MKILSHPSFEATKYFGDEKSYHQSVQRELLLELAMWLRIMRFHVDMRICGCGFPYMRIYFQHAHNPHIDICDLCGYAHYAHAFSEPHM